MADTNPFYYDIDPNGGTVTIDISNLGTNYYFVNSASTITLLAPWIVVFDAAGFDGSIIPDGLAFTVSVGGIILNGQTFTINGVSLTDLQALKGRSIQFGYFNGAWRTLILLNDGTADVSGTVLEDGSVTLAKLVALTSADIIVGNSGNVPAAVAMSGDVTISNTGVTAISAGVIVNADINASAAIAFSKMASLTASKALVSSAGGVVTVANQISAALGGTNIDTSASTGFPIVAAGTWSVGAITEVLLLQVSFESGYLGDFKITMPYAGTVTSIYAYATKVIAGTDNGTIVPKNNGGTTMTAGTITYTASDARGTAYTATPSANNTFAANDVLTFTTAKTTAGGVVQLSITVTRTS